MGDQAPILFPTLIRKWFTENIPLDELIYLSKPILYAHIVKLSLES